MGESCKTKNKKNYLNAYLSGYYGDTDFGNIEEADSFWKINKVNVTKALRHFRQVPVEGAQQRKYLSDSRVLSLSYIFFYSLLQITVSYPSYP
jgi:hypothetical protein